MMSPVHARHLALLVVVSLLALSVPGRSPWAAAAPSERQKTLRGLPAVLVEVAPPGEAAGRTGGSEQAIREAVEARLRRHGLPIVGQEERDARRLPTLYVRDLVLPHPSGITAYYVAVELWQFASVGAGTDAPRPYLPTWSSLGYLGTVDDPTMLGARLREAVTEQVDQFVDAYLGANAGR